MNTTSTSKRTLHNAGYYAFAGSLLLHAGFIAFITSWQWELKAPEKEPSKIIQVTFLPAPAKPEVTEKRKPLKTASTAPAQPLALHSAAILKLRPRTPDLALPTRQPVKAAYRMPLAIHTTQKNPLIRQPSLFKKAMHPTAARPLKVERTHHGTRQGMRIRPLPVFNTHWTPSSHAMAQTNSQLRSYPADIHPRTAAPAVQPAQDFSPHARSPVSTGPIKTSGNNVPPLPRPNPSPSFSFAKAGFNDQPAPEKSISIKSGGAQVASLPPQVNANTSGIGDGGGADLGLLRGTFAGKVRQRIVNAQSYPRIARRRGLEGQPVVAFTLDKRGRLTKVDLAQTSGYQLLDQAALKAVQKAAPYPEIPAQLELDSFQFKLPISFVLK